VYVAAKAFEYNHRVDTDGGNYAAAKIFPGERWCFDSANSGLQSRSNWSPCYTKKCTVLSFSWSGMTAIQKKAMRHMLANLLLHF